MEGRRTEHAALLLDQGADVAEDLRELVDASLNLADLLFALLNEGLLECELLGRELVLEDLRLPLRRRRAGWPLFVTVEVMSASEVGMSGGRTPRPPPLLLTSRPVRLSAAVLRSPAARAGKRPETIGNHATSSARKSYAWAVRVLRQCI